MRRKDKEITDRNEIEMIIEKSTVCRLAMVRRQLGLTSFPSVSVSGTTRFISTPPSTARSSTSSGKTRASASNLTATRSAHRRKGL